VIDPIAIAVPVFLAAIGVEVLVARQFYRFNDAIAAMMCGVSQQATGVFLHAALLAPYAAVEAATPGRLTGAWAWIVGMIGVDLAYYAWHRWTHVSNLGWATHVVHHQSETYNLAIALRQSLTSSLSSAPFYLPLAIAGVPTAVFALCLALNTLYQFWIHTEAVRRLPGWFEAVFNTPSHHRVHHAVNPRYLDRNYAGILIVWDRLFGTFEPESERPIYGTVKPTRSFDPLVANGQWLAVIARDALAGRGWDRVAVWWRHPGWRPANLPPWPDAATALAARAGPYDPPMPRWAPPYVLAHFLPVVALVVQALLLQDRASLPVLLGLAAQAVIAGSSFAALFEGRRWWTALEAARLLTLPLAWYAAAGPAVAPGFAGPALCSLGWLALRPSDLRHPEAVEG
jgi:sterol desaturase/sphingolipid hydroxylase (fatty acid hydroxylase superfamily)